MTPRELRENLRKSGVVDVPKLEEVLLELLDCLLKKEDPFTDNYNDVEKVFTLGFCIGVKTGSTMMVESLEELFRRH